MRVARPDIEAEIYAFVNDYIDKNKVYPTYREIAAGVGFRAVSSVYPYIKRMQESGKLGDNGKRGVSTAEQQIDITRVPLVGNVACGTPIFAEENIEEFIPVLKSELGNGEFFALRASGDSMINAGIEDGELVFIKKQCTAEEGDIVVALIDDEATLKYFHNDRRRKKIVLRPANDKYPDMEFDNVVLQGKAVKVLKNL